MATKPRPKAVLITGAYGSGKSAVVVEIAERLEERGLRYAALDLDWLAWADAGDDEWAEHRMMLKNMEAVVANYLEAGVRYFVMGRAFRDPAELESLVAAFPVLDWRLVRLEVPSGVIERRLDAEPEAGRHPELQALTAEVARNALAGIEDRTVSNDGPLGETAAAVLDWLAWT